MSGSKRNESVPNGAVRQRFERLAEHHGREQLAEHVALQLGWERDGQGNRQQPYQYRRGVLVALGLMGNRTGLMADTIPARRAGEIHRILDRVEAGTVTLQREAIGEDGRCDTCRGRGKTGNPRLGESVQRCRDCGGSGRKAEEAAAA